MLLQTKSLERILVCVTEIKKTTFASSQLLYIAPGKFQDMKITGLLSHTATASLLAPCGSRSPVLSLAQGGPWHPVGQIGQGQRWPAQGVVIPCQSLYFSSHPLLPCIAFLAVWRMCKQRGFEMLSWKDI